MIMIWTGTVSGVHVLILFLAEEYDRHMAGKKHNERLQAYLEKKRLAESSIFVKGFPARTEENEMAMYFGNFGMVSKVVFEAPDKKQKVTLSVHVYI